MFGDFGGLANLGLGLAGSALGGMFGDQSGAFEEAARLFQEQAARYNPYIDRGNEAGTRGMEEYNKLLQNPNFVQDMVTKGFFVSPYQKELEKRTTQAMNMNAANTGMIQSPAAQRALNDSINNMTGQFMDNYINRGMQSYGMGLSGLDSTAKMGLSGLNAQDALLESMIGANLKGQQSSQGALANAFGNAIGVGMNYFGNMPSSDSYSGPMNAAGMPWTMNAGIAPGSGGYSSYNLGY